MDQQLEQFVFQELLSGKDKNTLFDEIAGNDKELSKMTRVMANRIVNDLPDLDTFSKNYKKFLYFYYASMFSNIILFLGWLFIVVKYGLIALVVLFFLPPSLLLFWNHKPLKRASRIILLAVTTLYGFYTIIWTLPIPATRTIPLLLKLIILNNLLTISFLFCGYVMLYKPRLFKKWKKNEHI